MKGYSTVSLAEFNKSVLFLSHQTDWIVLANNTEKIIFQYEVNTVRMAYTVNVSKSHISLTNSKVSELLFCVAIRILNSAEQCLAG